MALSAACLINKYRHYTYEEAEDMYAPIYLLLPWLLHGIVEGYVTTVAENIRGAYPSRRCDTSDFTM